MKTPKDLYIITTAKKRDSKEWEEDCSKCYLFFGEKDSWNPYGVKVVIDSWNNIKKYKDIFGAFFIFDEQRVVGSGTWVKSFLDIARKNQWILLSATPGDIWNDYIPVFIANGFYKNKTEFNSMHCVFSRFSKYPKIERYVGTKLLEKYRDRILVNMEDERKTIRHNIQVNVGWDRNLYMKVFRERWDPWENCPIEETGKLLYLTRKSVNSHESRITEFEKILKDKKYLIVFYNYDYELTFLKDFLDTIYYTYSEWNGHKHQNVPKDPNGWVYLVQYFAGAEGWNCITTDTIVFYSQTYSYKTLEQASGRIDRMNTPFLDLYYYHFVSPSPIDRAIKSALIQKKNFNENLFVRGK